LKLLDNNQDHIKKSLTIPKG